MTLAGLGGWGGVRGKVPVFHYAGTILATIGHSGALIAAYAAFTVRVSKRVCGSEGDGERARAMGLVI